MSALGEMREVFVVVRAKRPRAYAASEDRSVADYYSKATGFPIEVWTERLEAMPETGMRFWNIIDPTGARFGTGERAL